MRFSLTRICLPPTLLLLLAVGITPAKAQETAAKQRPETPSPTLLSQLFPEPTGANGYEEIAMACDLAGVRVVVKENTLLAKRRLLSDPACTRALLLLRQGMAKSRQPSRSQNASDSAGPLATLVSLLALEQYVLMADGRTEAALNSLSDGLRLGYLAKAEGLFGSGLMGEDGFLIDYILLMGFARYLPRLSARDCDQLTALVREYLSSPDTTQIILERARQRRMEQVAQLRQDPNAPLLSAWLQRFEGGRGVSKETAALRSDLEAVKENPAAREALAAELTQHINAYFDAERTRLRSVPYTPPPALPSMATPAGRFVRLLTTNQSQTLDMLAGFRVQVQLLGVHAAIRRFQWEQDRLPATLAELNLKQLVIDPFTGKEFGYKKADMLTYELSSEAPMKTAMETSYLKAALSMGVLR